MGDFSKTGEQGVQLVVAELLERKLNPYRPVVDDHGVDIMLSTGVRIQVKAAHLSKKSKNSANKTYHFSTQTNVYGEGGRARALTWKRRTFTGSCDLLILVGLDEKRFWVVPPELVDAHGDMSLILGPKPWPSPVRVQELVSQGMTLDQIAEELDCCPVTVWNRKRGIRAMGESVSLIRSFEDRWDLLYDPSAYKACADISVLSEKEECVATLAGPIAA